MRKVSQRRPMWVGVLAVMMMAAGGPALAASSGIMYQGTLADPSGNAPADGSYPMTFSVWSGLTGSSKLWEETGHTVTVTKGAFAEELGLTTSFGTIFDGGAARWLEISVNLGGGLQQFTPRVPFAMVPFARRAAKAVDADTVDGSHAASFWNTLGNAGTVDGTNFLGTTDNVAFDLRVNNLRALRVEPTATSPNLIGGHGDNSVMAGAYGATIGGGGSSGAPNVVTDIYGVVGGGQNNRAGDGEGTLISSIYATVGGGATNTASGQYSTVGGGNSNVASKLHATVGGGDQNTASNMNATVSGGTQNSASGSGAMIPGGSSNTATGMTSFAAGQGAGALHSGCFVWVDNTGTATDSTGANQFRVRSTGGVWFYTNTGTAGLTLAAGGGSWTSISDRNVKENFEPVDCREVLDKVAALPITKWNYKAQDKSIRHVGPMAQDLYAAFGVGETDTGITTVDADGVALAAIKGLNQRLKDKDQEIAELRTEMNELKALVKTMAAK